MTIDAEHDGPIGRPGRPPRARRRTASVPEAALAASSPSSHGESARAEPPRVEPRQQPGRTSRLSTSPSERVEAAEGARSSRAQFEPDREWTEAALRRFADSKDRSLRNEIIRRNCWIAEVAARRFGNRGEPIEDLVQVGLVGLVKAVERFDPGQGTPFVAYAMPTIVGEIKRHFRSASWSVSVPRRTKELCAAVQTAVVDLTQSLQRPPSVDEIAQRIGSTSEAVLRAMEASQSMRSLSCDRSAEPGQRPLADSYGTPDSEIGRTESSITVAALLKKLPPRERELLELRFRDELTQREIAAKTGLSQVHVSRLLRSSLTSLQRHLPDGLPD